MKTYCVSCGYELKSHDYWNATSAGYLCDSCMDTIRDEYDADGRPGEFSEYVDRVAAKEATK